MASDKSAVWITRLPNEILLQIFTIFVRFRGSYHSSLELHEGPWVLIQTCHIWRHIVLSTPRFWSDIYLYFKPPLIKIDVVCWQKCMRLISLQLERSCDYPLSIVVDIDMLNHIENPRGVGYGNVKKLAKLLFSHRQRWRSLKLQGFAAGEMQTALFWIQHSTTLECPLLERLGLDCLISPSFLLKDEADSLGKQLFTSQGCPRLISAGFHHEYLSTEHLPWTQLTELELHHIDIRTFLLRRHLQLTNLCKLAIGSSASFAEVDTSGPSLLPRLQSLTLGESSWSILVDWFTTPTLEELRVNDVCLHIQATTSLIHVRSHCNAILTSLACNLHLSSVVAKSAFYGLLESLINLQSLEVSFHEQEANCLDFASALTRRNSYSFIYCPRLRHIQLEMSTIEKRADRYAGEACIANMSPILDMLEVRSSGRSDDGISGLRGANIYPLGKRWTITQADASRVSALRAGGMEVILQDEEDSG